jgi:hypothetical protein
LKSKDELSQSEIKRLNGSIKEKITEFDELTKKNVQSASEISKL